MASKKQVGVVTDPCPKYSLKPRSTLGPSGTVLWQQKAVLCWKEPKGVWGAGAPADCLFLVQTAVNRALGLSPQNGNPPFSPVAFG